METKVGIIGYGSMGSMLIKGFINNKVVRQDKVYISTRSVDKLEKIKSEYQGINTFSCNNKTAENADIIFICVKPAEVRNILDEIKESIKSETHIVSIAGAVMIGDMEKIIAGKITKMIPSLTSEVNEGISLVCHNEKVKKSDKENLYILLNSISTVKEIEEKDFEIAPDLTSCAPGLFAAIFNEYVEASLRYGSLTREESTEMVMKTLYGTAKLMVEKSMGFSEILERVATKGGITEEGAKILQGKLPEVFASTFEATLHKHKIVKSRIKDTFSQEER